MSGPASSGKSLWAETLAARSQRPVDYLATGPQRVDDPDWQARLRRHRERRPPHWRCQEVGMALADAIACSRPEALLLIDSLGTWVAGGLELDAKAWGLQTCRLFAVLESAVVPVILVAEETAWGVVPPTAIGLLFRDRLAELTRQLMPLCDGAWLVLHGRAVDLMALSHPVESDMNTVSR